jgi:DNA-3-methyladenine glycosylase II
MSPAVVSMAPRRSARISAAVDQKPVATQITTAVKENKSKNVRNGIQKKRKASTAKDNMETATVAAASLDGSETPAKLKRNRTDKTDDGPFSNNGTTRLTPPPLDRPVEPHRTNATLVTPRGSSRVAYPPGAESVSPSKTGLPRPVATTGTLLEKAVAHLIAADPRLKPVIDKNPCSIFSPEGLAERVDPFQSLISSIIGQQVSGAAAKSIKNKFVALFNADDGPDEMKRFPTPAEVARYDIATLRTAGLSQRKAEYIQGLAEKFVSGELSTEMLLRASDEEVLEKLIAVRGLGKWTVEMFTCFALKRTDVFSTGDLGVQ